MKAITIDRYGPASVLCLNDVPAPTPAKGEVLVKLHNSAVTTADWRLRASAFPGGLWLIGRLMMGLFRPRHRVPGMAFAGHVAATGTGVTEFSIGDAVYGFGDHGAHADYMRLAETSAIAPLPDGLPISDAAALPFGALSALVFLRDFAELGAHQNVLIIGATGGVGAYAVQIARHYGARITAVCSAKNHELAFDLGADRVIDYHTDDPLVPHARYDLIMDCVGASTYRRALGALRAGGMYLPLNFGLREIWQSLKGKTKDGRHMKIGVSGDSKQDLLVLNDLVASGAVRPVIDRRYPLAEIVSAHERVQSRHARGTVVLDIA